MSAPPLDTGPWARATRVRSARSATRSIRSPAVPALIVALGTTSVAPAGPVRLLPTADATSSRPGTGAERPQTFVSQALGELRARSGLTWGQLAGLLGVERRSLHAWARGGQPNATNLARLVHLLARCRALDHGQPTETAFSLLAEFGRPAERRVPAPIGSRRPPRPSAEAQVARRAFHPVELLGALHDLSHPSDPLVGGVPVFPLRAEG